MKMNSKKAFTLIELLIVIAIIGILAVAFLPSLLGAPSKGRDAQRLATVQKIQSFLVSESLVGTSLPAGAVDPAGCIAASQTTVANSISKLINDNIADFGGTFPKDPQTANTMVGTCTTAGSYGYVKFTAGNYTAGVYAHMENVENANIKCGTITATADPDLEIALVATDANCYLALVQ